MTDTILPGNGYRLYRMVTSVPEFVCMTPNLSHNKTKDMDKTLVLNCDDPTKPATTVSTPKSVGFSINFGGAAIMKHYSVIEDDYNSKAAVPYRIVAVTEDGLGNGQWDGNVHLTSLQFQKQAEGIVQFTCQMDGEGDLPFTLT